MEVRTIDKKDRYYQEIINCLYNQWGKERNETLKQIDENYDNALGIDSLPIMRALIINDTLIGSYELNEKDDIDNEEYTPYLAKVYVKEKYRHRGYGSVMIKDAISLAKNLGYKTLYLHSRLENFYELYGFKFFKEVDTKYGKKRVFKYEIKE